MFENNRTKDQKVHYSRYIASWLKSGGSYNDFYGADFKTWLYANGLTETEIYDLIEMATCGKMELEFSAKAYLNNKKQREEQNRKEASWQLFGLGWAGR